MYYGIGGWISPDCVAGSALDPSGIISNLTWDDSEHWRLCSDYPRAIAVATQTLILFSSPAQTMSKVVFGQSFAPPLLLY
jgi:hypothetical protein